MSKTSLTALTNTPPHSSGWRQVRQSFSGWSHRVRSRNELMSLSDRNLQDIGISRSTADFEASKPFWMA